tara:strand:- start:1194 stop:1379 length:186 start_codon:yes stop_codon:yes gene_type:complete
MGFEQLCWETEAAWLTTKPVLENRRCQFRSGGDRACSTDAQVVFGIVTTRAYWLLGDMFTS